MERTVFKTANSIGHYYGRAEDLLQNVEPIGSGDPLYPAGIEINEDKQEEVNKSSSGGPLYPAGVVIKNK